MEIKNYATLGYSSEIYRSLEENIERLKKMKMEGANKDKIATYTRKLFDEFKNRVYELLKEEKRSEKSEKIDLETEYHGILKVLGELNRIDSSILSEKIGDILEITRDVTAILKEINEYYGEVHEQDKKLLEHYKKIREAFDNRDCSSLTSRINELKEEEFQDMGYCGDIVKSLAIKYYLTLQKDEIIKTIQEYLEKDPGHLRSVLPSQVENFNQYFPYLFELKIGDKNERNEFIEKTVKSILEEIRKITTKYPTLDTKSLEKTLEDIKDLLKYHTNHKKAEEVKKEIDNLKDLVVAENKIFSKIFKPTQE